MSLKSGVSSASSTVTDCTMGAGKDASEPIAVPLSAAASANAVSAEAEAVGPFGMTAGAKGAVKSRPPRRKTVHTKASAMKAATGESSAPQSLPHPLEYQLSTSTSKRLGHDAVSLLLKQNPLITRVRMDPSSVAI